MTQNISSKQSWTHKLSLAVDVFMIILVILDLAWFAFDGLFEVSLIQKQLFLFFPAFTAWYETYINHNFLFYEASIFVSLFMAEFIIRWFLAVIYRRYDKWFFYPLYHWYDVLGFIPTSSFRILRFIRIAVLLYRLHRWKVIDLNDYAIYRQILHYYNILVEEISDRVAVNLLEEAKSEIKQGEPIGNAIVSQVLEPYRPQIVNWASAHIQEGIRTHYREHREEIQRYLKQIIRETVDTNKEVHNLERIPVFGAMITDSINTAVCDITFGVIDRLTSDLASSEKAIVIETIVSAVTEVLFKANQSASTEQKQMSNQLITDSIDLIIERVKVKQWKIKEQAEDMNDVFD